VSFALPFRYRFEITSPRGYAPAGAGTPYRSAHYESVDEWFHHVHSRPSQDLMSVQGPAWTGMDVMQLQPYCATLKSDLDLVGHLSVRDAIGDYKDVYNKRYKIVYCTITRLTSGVAATSTVSSRAPRKYPLELIERGCGWAWRCASSLAWQWSLREAKTIA
jgi:hypothetical protein